VRCGAVRCAEWDRSLFVSDSLSRVSAMVLSGSLFVQAVMVPIIATDSGVVGPAYS